MPIFAFISNFWHPAPRRTPGGGGQHSLAGECGGGANSDYRRESLALCNTLCSHHFSLCVNVKFQQGIKISQEDHGLFWCRWHWHYTRTLVSWHSIMATFLSTLLAFLYLYGKKWLLSALCRKLPVPIIVKQRRYSLKRVDDNIYSSFR